MNTFAHAFSQAPISGLRLAPGAILAVGDVYESTGGHWEPCPVPGLSLAQTETFWVRPGNISEGARELLGFMTRFPGGLYGHIAKYSYGYVLLPKSDWSPSTALVNMSLPRVENPSCIQELVDVGFLEANWCDGYSVSKSGREWSARMQA